MKHVLLLIKQDRLFSTFITNKTIDNRIIKSSISSKQVNYSFHINTSTSMHAI